jgi:hypothetical protein
MESDTKSSPDPVFQSSLRESWRILVFWAVFFVWVVGYSSLFGYPEEGEPIATVFGMPSWVFWGVFLPWIVSGAIMIWFALTQIEDHPLDEFVDAEDSDG